MQNKELLYNRIMTKLSKIIKENLIEYDRCIINEAFIPEYDKYTKNKKLKLLLQYVVNNYVVLGDKTPGFIKEDPSDSWYILEIPITLSGFSMKPEESSDEENEIFAIDINPELEKYLDNKTYVETTDDLIDDYGLLRVLTYGNLSIEDAIDILDGLLKNVPDPALKRK